MFYATEYEVLTPSGLRDMADSMSRKSTVALVIAYLSDSALHAEYGF